MPHAAPRLCAKHGPHTGRCEPCVKAHQVATDRQRGSASARGYASKAWFRTRQRVLTRDLFKCQTCGRLVMGKREAHIDHIVPKARGGTDDMDNLQTLCVSCHSRKTAREDGGFGQRPTG